MWDKIQKASVNPESLQELRQWAQHDPNFILRLIQAIDGSSYHESDWIEALLGLRRWVQTRGQQAESADALGFVSCCGSVSGTKVPRQGLWDVVEEMLNNYGFEAAGLKGSR